MADAIVPGYNYNPLYSNEFIKCKSSITVPFDCLMNEIIKKCDKIQNFTICELIEFIGNSFEYIWFFKYKLDDPTIYGDDGAYKIINDIIKIFIVCFSDLSHLTNEPFKVLYIFKETLEQIRTKIEKVYNIKPKKLTLDLYNTTNLKSFYNINIKLRFEEDILISLNPYDDKKDYLDNKFLNMIKEHTRGIKNKPTIAILSSIIPYDYTIAFKKIKEYCLSKLENLLFILDIIIDGYNILDINRNKLFQKTIMDKIISLNKERKNK